MKKTIFISIFLLLSNILFSTQKVENEKIFSPHEVVLNLVLRYLPDHKTVCSVAATSTYYDKFVQSTANDRKYSIIGCPGGSNNYGYFVHKYGSARYYAYKRKELWELALGYHEINKNNDRFKIFKGFISPLPHNPKPFFN